MSYLVLNEENQEPLDICMESVGMVLALGTVNEIVKKQPDNKQAAERKLDLETRLKAHIEQCTKCAEGFQEKA